MLPNSVGFGEIEPSSVFLGGEAESAVNHISWTSWGSPQATGQGTGYYYTTSSANGRYENETLIAFDLGTCDGSFMYERLEEFFPEQGQTFNPSNGIDICSHQ